MEQLAFDSVRQKSSRRHNPARAKARRQQILEAAADCFRRTGFHGASVADISACARMSAGHIYYYFSSKDAIVRAVIEDQAHQTLVGLQELMRSSASGPDLLASVVSGLVEIGDSIDVLLMLEIKAEALRNPFVRSIVEVTQAAQQERMAAFLAFAQARGAISPKLEPTAASGVVKAILESFCVTQAGLSGLDRMIFKNWYEEMFVRLLSQSSVGIAS